MIHVIKHNIDPNSNLNYRRKIGPVCYPLGVKRWKTTEVEITP